MKKILIISTNAIGDTYLSMSAIPILKEKPNDVVVDFVIEEHSAFLFEYEGIRNLIVVKRTVSDLFSKIIQIRKEKYDYVFSFFPGLVNTFFLLFAKSKNKGGFPNFIRKKEWANSNQIGFVKKGLVLQTVKWRKESNFLERITSVLSKFDFSVSEVGKYVFHCDVDLNKFNNSVVIHPFSRIRAKSLSRNQLISLVKMIYDMGEKNIIILGDNKISEPFRDIFPGVKFYINPDIKELIQLLHCKLFVSVDSFPLHVADAYSTNFVGLFSTTNPRAVLINSEKAINFNATAISEIQSDKIISELNNFLLKNEF